MHSDFAQSRSIKIPFHSAPTPVTAMKIKEKFGEVQSHLLVLVSYFVSLPPAIISILLIALYITSQSARTGGIAEMGVGHTEKVNEGNSGDGCGTHREGE